ncbi:MAG: NAD(P)/FAD-dependent oxidoreductase, partial [Clostridia bacterium]|nr:NAD(P)/FAD-dependent oxidoreductase [Clostridia bacterium]
MYDVAVVGGGVIGGLVLRELARYDIKAVMLEKEADVASGSSKSNTGIVHAGFDAVEGSLKARFNVLGAKMMENVCAELGVKYKKNGSLVVAYAKEELPEIKKLYDRGVSNGVPDMEILDQASLRKLEPNIADNAVGALYAKSAGIVCPYGLTVASIGNAMDNGASLICEFEVSSITKDGENFIITSSDGKTVSAKVVINCAGMSSDKVASLIGDNSFKINARKGEYILLDKSNFNLERTVFSCPTKAGKGIVVTKTVDGNTLLGPTSVEIPDKADKTTTAD